METLGREAEKLDLGHRHHAGEREAERSPDDAGLRQGRVHNAVRPEAFHEATRGSEDAAQLAHVEAEKLAEEGVSATVLDLRTLVPLDVETLCAQVVKTGRCVIVHEAPLSAGFGAEISATLMEEVFYDLDAPVARVGAFDVPFPAASLEDYYLPSMHRVLAAVRRTMQS